MRKQDGTKKEITYWRRFWGLRGEIFHIVQNEWVEVEGYGESLPLYLRDLIKIRKILVGIYFNRMKFKQSCGYYWDYNLTQIKYGLKFIWNITRVIWRLRLNPNSMEVFLYDSY